jgi:hypothetical protein
MRLRTSSPVSLRCRSQFVARVPEPHIDGTGTIDPELEAEADAFASRALIPPQAAARLQQLSNLSEVHAFAEEIGVADGSSSGGCSTNA